MMPRNEGIALNEDDQNDLCCVLGRQRSKVFIGLQRWKRRRMRNHEVGLRRCLLLRVSTATTFHAAN